MAPSLLRAANGSAVSALGFSSFPFALGLATRTVEALVAPSLSLDVLLLLITMSCQNLEQF